MSDIVCLHHPHTPADPIYTCTACTQAYLARVRDEQEKRDILTGAQRDTILKRISGMLGVKFRLRKRMDADGCADVATNTILLRDDILNVHRLVSIALHEAMHILAYRQGKYEVYHSPANRPTRDEAIAYKRTALQAELYVDKRAEALCKRWFPHIKFVSSYRNKRERKSLRESQFPWADYYIERLKK